MRRRANASSTHTYQYIELCTHAARAPDETTIALTRDTSTTSHTCTDSGFCDNKSGLPSEGGAAVGGKAAEGGQMAS